MQPAQCESQNTNASPFSIAPFPPTYTTRRPNPTSETPCHPNNPPQKHDQKKRPKCLNKSNHLVHPHPTDIRPRSTNPAPPNPPTAPTTATAATARAASTRRSSRCIPNTLHRVATTIRRRAGWGIRRRHRCSTRKGGRGPRGMGGRGMIRGMLRGMRMIVGTAR